MDLAACDNTDANTGHVDRLVELIHLAANKVTNRFCFMIVVSLLFQGT
jgi:hypothetical protein